MSTEPSTPANAPALTLSYDEQAIFDVLLYAVRDRVSLGDLKGAASESLEQELKSAAAMCLRVRDFMVSQRPAVNAPAAPSAPQP